MKVTLKQRILAITLCIAMITTAVSLDGLFEQKFNASSIEETVSTNDSTLEDSADELSSVSDNNLDVIENVEFSVDDNITEEIPEEEFIVEAESNLLLSEGDSITLDSEGNPVNIMLLAAITPDTVTYTYSSNTLTITGSGTVTNGWQTYNDTWAGYVTKVKTVKINSTNLTSINSDTFANCTALATVTLSAYNGGTFNSQCFRDITTITKVNLSTNITSIGSYAFYGCTGLKNIGYNKDTDGDGTGDTWTQTFRSVSTIGNYAFYGCTSLVTVTTGNTVSTIGNYAFYGCTSLTTVTTGTGVTSIGTDAFSDCTSLATLTIGAGVTSIGSNAFYNAPLSTQITINAKDLQTHNNAFNNKETAKIVFGTSVTQIPDRLFYGCSSISGTITIPNTVTSIGNYAFYGCSGFSTLRFTNTSTCTSIGDYAFYGCSAMTKFQLYTSSESYTNNRLPASLTSLGSHAFENCSSLVTVVIPVALTEIKDYTFYNCTSLATVRVGQSWVDKRNLDTDHEYRGLEIIGNYAFAECTSLTKFGFFLRAEDTDGVYYDRSVYNMFNNNIKSIGDCVFYNCSSLGIITINADIQEIGENVFHEDVIVRYPNVDIIKYNHKEEINKDLSVTIEKSSTASSASKSETFISNYYFFKGDIIYIKTDSKCCQHVTNKVQVTLTNEDTEEALTWTDKASGVYVSDTNNYISNSKYDAVVIPEDGYYTVTVKATATHCPHASNTCGASVDYLYLQTKEYPVTYYSNLDSEETYETVKVHNIDLEIADQIFTKIGYSLVEWNTKKDGSGTSYGLNDIYTTNEELVLYAQWSPNTYKVIYNGNGHTSGSVASQSFIYENSVNISANSFVKTDYGFVGWNTQADGSGVGYSVGQKYSVASDLVLYAQWSNVVTEYTVNHYKQTLNGTYSITPDETVTTAAYAGETVSPSVKTYTGFTSPSAQTVLVSEDGSTVINYYYSRNQYTVTLNKGTGVATVTGSGTYYYGASVTISATLSTGYKWSKWSGTHSTTTQSYTFTMPASNVTDTANATLITYTVTYNGNGNTGGSTASQTFNYGSSVTISDNGFTKTDYEFVCWNTKADGSGIKYAPGNTYSAKANLTLYAQWQLAKIDIPVKINWDDENNDIEGLSTGVRPKNVVLKLMNGNTVVATATVTGDNSVPATSNTWTYTFEGLDKYDSNGNVITYTVVEEQPSCLDGSLKYEVSYSSDTYTITNTITNILKPEEPDTLTAYKVVGTITWLDENDKYHFRPDSVVLELYQNGSKIKEIEVFEGTTTYEFSGLDKIDSNKKLYEYVVVERTVDNYSITYNSYETSVTETDSLGNKIITTTLHYDVANTFTPIEVLPHSSAYLSLTPVINNSNGEIATDEDFIANGIDKSENIFVTLKQMDMTWTATDAANGVYQETYLDTYSGVEFNILLNIGNTSTMTNLMCGKYEIVVADNKSFDFKDIEELAGKNATFSYENGKYYVTFSYAYEEASEDLAVNFTFDNFNGYESTCSVKNLYQLFLKKED